MEHTTVPCGGDMPSAGHGVATASEASPTSANPSMPTQNEHPSTIPLAAPRNLSGRFVRTPAVSKSSVIPSTNAPPPNEALVATDSIPFTQPTALDLIPTISESAKMRRRISARPNYLSSTAPSPAPEEQHTQVVKKRVAADSATSSQSRKRGRPSLIEPKPGKSAEKQSDAPLSDPSAHQPKIKQATVTKASSTSSEISQSLDGSELQHLQASLKQPTTQHHGKELRRSTRVSLATPNRARNVDGADGPVDSQLSVEPSPELANVATGFSKPSPSQVTALPANTETWKVPQTHSEPSVSNGNAPSRKSALTKKPTPKSAKTSRKIVAVNPVLNNGPALPASVAREDMQHTPQTRTSLPSSFGVFASRSSVPPVAIFANPSPSQSTSGLTQPTKLNATSNPLVPSSDPCSTTQHNADGVGHANLARPVPPPFSSTAVNLTCNISDPSLIGSPNAVPTARPFTEPSPSSYAWTPAHKITEQSGPSTGSSQILTTQHELSSAQRSDLRSHNTANEAIDGAGALVQVGNAYPTPHSDFGGREPAVMPNESNPSPMDLDSQLSDDGILLNLQLEQARTRHLELAILMQQRKVQLRQEKANTPTHIPNNAIRCASPVASLKAPSVEPLSPVERLVEKSSDFPTYSASGTKPIHDTDADGRFLADVLEWLGTFPKKSRGKRNFGDQAVSRLQPLLRMVKSPIPCEALFLTGKEAAELVKPGILFTGPIITQGQQALALQTPEKFLDELWDEEQEVSIQDQSVNLSRSLNHARFVSVTALKKRLSNASDPRGPWNCLELAALRDEFLRPAFLYGVDCTLLTKIKQPGSNHEAGRRGFVPGYVEAEKWALLGQAGALTEPHQDSHGYSTFITVNHGRIGFGWLSNPTVEEREGWNANPQEFSGGNWRYVVLLPGQTIYFPAGTVHFVFRLPTDGHTLAFGGHVLRCSQIVPWVRTMIEERKQPNITNEDLKIAAAMYLNRVERFVKQAKKAGAVAMQKWGGEEACLEFLKLKTECLKIKPPNLPFNPAEQVEGAKQDEEDEQDEQDKQDAQPKQSEQHPDPEVMVED